MYSLIFKKYFINYDFSLEINKCNEKKINFFLFFFLKNIYLFYVCLLQLTYLY